VGTASTESANPERYPSSIEAWWLVCVLFVVACISYADRLVLSVLVDPLRTSLGLTDSAVGVLQGPAFTLVYVFSSLLFGRLADRSTRRYLLLGGATVWCICTMLCAMAQGFWTLLLARMLVGASEATLIPPAISMIADSFSARRRGIALGIFTVGTGVGGPFGITLGGALLAAAQSGRLSALPWVGALEPWRLALVSMGVLGLAGPLLLITVREPTRRERSAGDTDLASAARHFISDRRLLAPLYLAMALLAVGDYGLVTWVPTTLSRRFAWPPDQVGAAFGVICAAAGLAGALSGGYFSDMAGRRRGTRARLMVCALGASAAASGAAAISGDRAAYVLTGLGLWIFASTFAAVGGLSSLQEIVPGRLRGTAVSVLTFCNTLLGLGVGPNLVTLTTEHVYGWPSAVGFAISTVMVPAGLAATFLFLTVTRSEASTLLAPHPAPQGGRVHGR